MSGSYVVSSFYGAGPRGSSIDLTMPGNSEGRVPGLMLVPTLDEKRDEPGPSALQSPQRLALPNQASRRSVSGCLSKRLRPPRETAHTEILGALPRRAAEPWHGALWPTRLLPYGYVAYPVEFLLSCALHRIAPVETALRSCTAGLNAYAYS
jgi:hypothetical protein